ncbi:monovalent cation/H+ antiporter subunit D family protein [Rhodobacteraceae bacterium NNCM2]|nr:monovalent cation/H+ antiporter subunit D family protein [Coraliihabitans acroporae]
MTAAGGVDWGAHLPALQVVVPMLGAVTVALIRKPAISWLITLAVSLSMPVISALLLHEVFVHGTISYAMGSWEPPLGIEYRVDEVNGFLLMLVSLISAIVAIYMPRSIANEIAPERQGWYYTMFLMALCGLQGMAITGDAFNIFVFMEISSLAMYVMIGLGPDRRALVAAFQYLVIGTIGATFYVIGVGMVFAMTGTLNLYDLAQLMPAVETKTPIHAGLAFIAVGISLKIALFPMHLWLPNAYAFAPSAATAFLAATATKVAIYLLIRFFYSIFGIEFTFGSPGIQAGVLLLACLGMLLPSMVAIFQVNVKRMLAYSSVSQVGYMILGIALANEAGLTGGISHMFNHGIIKASLFLAIGCVVFATGIRRIEQMAGIGRTMPLTMAAFVIAGLGLIGVPGTAGFVSKWYLILGAAEAGMWWLVMVIVISSALAIFYIGRIIEVAYFRVPCEAADNPVAVPLEMQAMTWLLAIAVIYFGLQTEISAGIPARAAELLMQGWYVGGGQ